MKYIDLVIVEVDGVKILCQAPCFSYLHQGDKVIVGDHMVDVIASDSCQPDETDNTVKLILNAFDIEHIADVPKLKANVKIIDYIYDDGEEGGESDE